MQTIDSSREIPYGIFDMRFALDMCTALDIRCGVRRDFSHIESQSDISVLRSKNIAFANGEHIDKAFCLGLKAIMIF